MTVNNLKLQLEREHIKHMNNKSDLICVKEYNDTFTVLGMKVGPFKLGHPYSFNNFLAKEMVKRGYLKFDENHIIEPSTIQKINFKESTNKPLEKMQDLIYIRARDQLEIIEEKYEQEMITLRERNKLKSDYNDLINVRLEKINRLAKSNNTRQKSMLTTEEQILYHELSNIITTWQQFFKN